MADAAPFSTLQDLKLHWPALPDTRTAEATQKIAEASIELRVLYPDLDARLSAGTLAAAVPRLVVNRIVKRAMDKPIEEYAGVQSATAQTGPFATTLEFANTDGNMYLSKADHRLLRVLKPAVKAFTIMPVGN